MIKVLYVVIATLSFFLLSAAKEEEGVLPFMNQTKIYQNIEEENAKSTNWINFFGDIKDRFVPLTMTVFFTIPVAFIFASFKESMERKVYCIKELEEIDKKIQELENQQESLEKQLQNVSMYEIPEDVEKIKDELSMTEEFYNRIYENIQKNYIDVELLL